jgi:hypothetical protein
VVGFEIRLADVAANEFCVHAHLHQLELSLQKLHFSLERLKHSDRLSGHEAQVAFLKELERLIDIKV